MSKIIKSQEQEITSLFNTAKDEIDKIDQSADEKKKEIVIKLAKKLECLIPQTDTISSTILKQLKGRVGKSLIHNCLPAKYKKEYRRENALKQNKKQLKKEEIMLAPLSALNQQKHIEVDAEEKMQKNKVSVMVGTDGRSYFQTKEDDEEVAGTASETHADYASKDKAHAQSSSSLQHTLEQKNPIKEPADHLDTQSKDTIYIDLSEGVCEDSEQYPEKQYQLILTDDQIVQDSDHTPTSHLSKDILTFEISWIFRDLNSRLEPLHSIIEDNGRVKLSGLIDKNTGIVISHYFGKLNHLEGQNHQYNDNSIDSSNRDDVDES